MCQNIRRLVLEKQRICGKCGVLPVDNTPHLHHCVTLSTLVVTLLAKVLSSGHTAPHHMHYKSHLPAQAAPIQH